MIRRNRLSSPPCTVQSPHRSYKSGFRNSYATREAMLCVTLVLSKEITAWEQHDDFSPLCSQSDSEVERLVTRQDTYYARRNGKNALCMLASSVVYV